MASLLNRSGTYYATFTDTDPIPPPEEALAQDEEEADRRADPQPALRRLRRGNVGPVDGHTF